MDLKRAGALALCVPQPNSSDRPHGHRDDADHSQHQDRCRKTDE